MLVKLWLDYMYLSIILSFLCTHTNTKTHIHICTYAHTPICTYAHMHICTYAHMHIRTYAHTHKHSFSFWNLLVQSCKGNFWPMVFLSLLCSFNQENASNVNTKTLKFRKHTSSIFHSLSLSLPLSHFRYLFFY